MKKDFRDKKRRRKTATEKEKEGGKRPRRSMKMEAISLLLLRGEKEPRTRTGKKGGGDAIYHGKAVHLSKPLYSSETWEKKKAARRVKIIGEREKKRVTEIGEALKSQENEKET